jgi:hypothetical protein
MRMRQLAALLIGMIFWATAGSSSAAIPRLINFQGRLSDAAGTPLSGNYAITLKVWDDASGGSSCFSETQTVTVTSGLFNVNIGGATSGGISSSCTFSAPYFLALQVGTDAAMSPRLALTTVPYAFAAERLDGALPSAILARNVSTGNVNVTGTLGIGTTAPGQKLGVAGNVNGTGLCIGSTCKTAWPGGTVTSVSAGTGITLSTSPITTTGTISVNTSVMQARVTGTCTDAFRAINADGTVTCVTAPAVGVCTWNGRSYTAGAVCRNGSADGTYCTSGKYDHRRCTCQSDGSWSCTTVSCSGLVSSC